MVEFNSHETHNIYPNLNHQQQFILNKSNQIKDYFVDEIKERELISTRLSKYIASFDYFDNSLIVFSVTIASISIAPFATVIGAPVGLISASFSPAFSIFTGIVKKLLRNKNKKHNEIVILARSKSNSIESKISEALINSEISHEDLEQLLMKKKNIENLKKALES